MMKLKVSFALLTTLFVATGVVANGALADDEFPSYLSEKYCEGIKLDFMTSSIKSLQRYREKQLASQHRGGMNNIRQYLEQRQDWMLECDRYLSATAKQRLFQDDKTTEGVFAAINSVASELNSLISGVTYSVEHGGNPTDVAAEKFDHLFKVVDNHQTLLLMKGQVVYR